MSQLAAFNVRAYPSFRPARVFRIFMTDRGLYFVRLKGLISASDAGGGFYTSANQAGLAWLIRGAAARSLASGVGEVEDADLDELVRDHKHNIFATPDDFVNASLDPPSIFGHGPHVARWKVELKGRRAITYQIEDVKDLRVALDHLPRALGAILRVSLK